MFDKIFQAQQKAEEIKRRLDAVTVIGESEGGKIQVTATANREFKEIQIDPDFLAQADREELEELLVVAINHAIQQADNISKTEMQAVTKDMLGGLGGMFGQ